MFKGLKIIIKMGFKSAKNTSNVNQSNDEYEVDDIIFYSKFVFKTIKSIDKYLRLLYTPGSASTNWEAINHSKVRDDEKFFDKVLGRVEERIGRIKIIDDWLIKDLYKEKYAFSFFNKFEGILNCYREYECLDYQYKNNFERRIIEIKMGLNYIGIDLYYD